MTDKDPLMSEQVEQEPLTAPVPEDVPEVQCDVCGRKYLWAADLAGKEITCKCGEKVKFPVDPADAHVAYKIIVEPEPPMAERLATKPTLEYQRRQFKPVRSFETERIKNLIAPLWFLGGGAAIEVLVALHAYRRNVGAALNHVGISIVGGTLIMILGMMIAAKARGINLGSFGTMTLKLAAITVAPAAICDLLRPILGIIPLIGGLILFGLQFILFFSFLGMLFDLDEQDAWFCCLVFFAVGGLFALAQNMLGLI